MDHKPATLNTVIIASTVTAVLLGCVLYNVRQTLAEQDEQIFQSQKEAADKLGRRIATLESQTTELAARPTTDTGTIDALHNELTSAKTTIGELTERIDELEKKPAPPAPVAMVANPTNSAFATLKSAVNRGDSYQAELDIWDKEHPQSAVKIPKLRTHALNGLPSDEKLRAQLRDLVNAETGSSETFPDNSIASRINRHLSGLVSIRKQPVITPEIKTLRESLDGASLEKLRTQVAALPEAQGARFADWLHLADDRLAMREELSALDTIP